MTTLKSGLFFLFILMVIPFHSQGQFWNLVWADEFNGVGINVTDWNFETGTGNSGWGNNEWQFYTARPENAFVQNGFLNIVAKKENYAGSSYTSARMTTQAKQSWKYGKVEARIKFPLRQGVWPAFWMLGSNFSTVGWPQCGEIDIMEHVNTSSDVHGTIHWDINGHNYYGNSTTLSDPNQFHIYSIEWDINGIRWFVDGLQYNSANTFNNINGTEEFHEPFFIILNMAVGGNWPGYPNPNDPLNDTLFVDYVRVYQNGLAPTKVEDKNKSDFQVYPNPATQQLVITTNSNELKNATVYNMVGVKVGSIHSREEDVIIDISNYKPGFYFIKLDNGIVLNFIKK